MKKCFAVLLFAVATPLAAQQQQPDPAKMFMQQMDANKDDKVSLEEFRKPTDMQFQQMDKNGDGYISADEAEAFHKEMQQRMEQMRKQMQQKGGGSGQSGNYGQPPQR